MGGGPVRALRLSYVGELGFELHHPIEHQAALYELLCDAGADLGLVDFGYRALDSLRLEKAYRLWGADMSADYTPLEAGLERFVKLDKGDFVGREALQRLDAGGPSIHLSCLTIDTARPTRMPTSRSTRTAGSSHTSWPAATATVGKSIALAYLPTEQPPSARSSRWRSSASGARPRRVAAALRPRGAALTA